MKGPLHKRIASFRERVGPMVARSVFHRAVEGDETALAEIEKATGLGAKQLAEFADCFTVSSELSVHLPPLEQANSNVPPQIAMQLRDSVSATTELRGHPYGLQELMPPTSMSAVSEEVRLLAVRVVERCREPRNHFALNEENLATLGIVANTGLNSEVARIARDFRFSQLLAEVHRHTGVEWSCEKIRLAGDPVSHDEGYPEDQSDPQPPAETYYRLVRGCRGSMTPYYWLPEKYIWRPNWKIPFECIEQVAHVHPEGVMVPSDSDLQALDGRIRAAVERGDDPSLDDLLVVYFPSDSDPKFGVYRYYKPDEAPKVKRLKKVFGKLMGA